MVGEIMKISVIVTVYNRLEYARNMLICLMNQEEQPYELIFSDDGSSEELMDYIGDLVNNCRFKIKHIKHADLGFRKTRICNLGVKESEGDYLLFIDQDVIFNNGLIKEVKGKIKKEHFVMGHPSFISREKKEAIQPMVKLNMDFDKILERIDSSDIDEVEKYFKKDRINNILYNIKLRRRGAKMAGLLFGMYKDDYIAINGYDENYKGWGYEDDDLCNRMYAYGLKSTLLKFEKYQIHMWHGEDPSKRKSLNEEYYSKRKKEIFKGNISFEYGYKQSIDSDQAEIKIIK